MLDVSYNRNMYGYSIRCQSTKFKLVPFHFTDQSNVVVVQPEPPIKANTTKITHTSLKETSISTQGSNMSLTLLSDLQALRRRLELAESGLGHHLHVSLGENSVQECSQHLLKLEVCNCISSFIQ
jgi:hypothetical protein